MLFMQLKMRLCKPDLILEVTRERSWSPFLAQMTQPVPDPINVCATSPKAVGGFVPLNGLNSHWGPELTKERGYFQSQFITCLVILQSSEQGRKSSAGLLGRAKEETWEKLCILEIQLKWLSNKCFQKFRKHSHNPQPKTEDNAESEVICWQISLSGLMHLKLYFYTVTGRFILLANRGMHLWSVSKLSVLLTCMKLSALHICLAWRR